jgi:DNA invertase Pin-like site-specific DNA recombinase
VATLRVEGTQSGPLIRAGLYLRISRDRPQLRLAVHRQEDDCREAAQRLGWSGAQVYIDNGLSASQFVTKPRGEYKRLLGDIKAGRLDAVVVWMEDRSHRQVSELAEFVETCRAAGITRYASVGTEYDLSDPDQVTMLFLVARESEAEVKRISVRVKRKHKELADNGQYHGGPKPYGYQGLMRDENGVVINKGRVGKAILETWERVRLVLLSPDRGRARTTSRPYLLSGVIHCGKCGKRLVGMPYPNGTRAYGCEVGTTYRGCGGVRRKAESVEMLIRETIFSLLDANPQLLRVLDAFDDEATQPTRVPAASSGREAWESASQDWRRRLIDALIESIAVLPQATSTFASSSILVRWRVEVLLTASSSRDSSEGGISISGKEEPA